MPSNDDVVFLLDCDNTLLDNDAIESDLGDRIATTFGAPSRDQYWKLFVRLRTELGFADYLGALQRYRVSEQDDPRLLLLSSFLIDYPFASRVYPGALDAIRHLARSGTTVIVSDGDVVFQPLKIRRSGLWDAVAGRVLIYAHKERMLDVIAERYPARHYVMVDDKRRILSAIKKTWGTRVTTILPLQGHYALDPRSSAAYAAADVTVGRIGDLAGLDVTTLLGVPLIESAERSSS